MTSTGQKALESRRRHEDKARAMQASLADERKVMSMATFETSTAKKIDQRTKQERFDELQRSSEINLLRRRQNLADLYNYEREQWQNEVLSRVESVEDRKQRIMERAYALRDKRESERLAFVQKCYGKQWRDACDDARTLDSKAMDMFLGQDRIATIQEKQRKKQELAGIEMHWLDLYNKHCEELEAAEKAKDDFRIKAAKDLQEGLRRQIAEHDALVNETIERNRREADAEILECQRAIEDEEALQRKLKEDAYTRGKDVLMFNEKYKNVRRDEEAEERRQDAQLLRYALRKEREAIAEEDAKREANKEASQKYRKYLEEMMIKEAEDNSGLEEVRRQEEERIWKARDAVLQAREDARKHLMKLVDEGRQEQISMKLDRMRREKEDEKIYTQKFLVDAAEGVARERAETQRRREAATANNQHLTDQINLRRQQQELERQEAYLADKHMQRIERLHRQRLAEQAGVLRTNFPVSSVKWYT